MRTDPFELLGVHVDATDEEIERAWRARLRLVHPDSHPDATPEVQADLAEQTQALNQARELLRNEHTRAMALHSHGRRPMLSAPVTPSAPPGWTPPPPTCPAYERPALPEVMHRTMGRGWVVAIVVVLVALTGAAAYKIVPIITEESRPPAEAASRESTLVHLTTALVDGTNRFPLAEGNCLAGDGVVQPVPCEQPHIGQVIASATTEAACPDGTDAVIDDQQPLLCVDLTP